MWRLRCPYFFLISPFFDTSGELCFLTVINPGCFHLYNLYLICIDFRLILEVQSLSQADFLDKHDPKKLICGRCSSKDIKQIYVCIYLYGGTVIAININGPDKAFLS